ncbi:MAG: ubiquinol-cytochrome C reductase, iron-sulfur subunit [Pseudomonadota bacterium]
MSAARRRVLVRLVKAGAVLILGGLLVVLLGSIWPTVTTQRVSIYVDAAALEPGDAIRTAIGNLPVLVVRRGDAELGSLDDSRVNDAASWQSSEPDGVDARHRGVDPRFLVVEALGTALQCELDLLPPSEDHFQGEPWAGGFADKCRGERYDWAGRVYRNQTAKRNLRVLPHTVDADDGLTVSQP